MTAKHVRYYSAVFASLAAGDVRRIYQRLKGDDEAGKVIFWNKPHVSLGELTPEEEILAGCRGKVPQFADAWSAERGYKD